MPANSRRARSRSLGDLGMVAVIQPPSTETPTRVAGGPDQWLARLYPGSLDEAIYRLGLATEAFRLRQEEQEEYARAARPLEAARVTDLAYDIAQSAYWDALDTVRHFREEAQDG